MTMRRTSSRGVNGSDAQRLELPEVDASLALAVYRLEANSDAIYDTFQEIAASDEESYQTARLRAYAHFRSCAYKLLSHYIRHGFQEAFRWLLGMRGAAPKRCRIPLHQNPFHWGLLAMKAAGGPFMSPNRLRELATDFQAAYETGVAEGELENFLRARKSQARRQALSTMLRELRRVHRPTLGE